MRKILKQGAEAILYIDRLDGDKVLVKERIKKEYRISQIDEKIRKSRTRSETRLLLESRKFGVQTPRILKVDEKENKIFMEFIEGTRIKEFFETARKNQIEKFSQEIGKQIGLLHANDIVHGDLTTSNIIIRDGKIFFIDFGLGFFSKRTEDKGVDMKLLFEALKSTHFKVLKLCWGNILKGYKKYYSKADEVLNKIEEIGKRARYVER